ncbi:Hypothetical predicted protein [Podarcis lilfordi]|uniref:Uncharacterized protein n=1 Tax=Podarcis lilfordi TaxID=74358 RepID=A0AA35NXT2_9SAUR|nr:Hypothetical predicted protein [Podarcis lilfordi]
MHTHPSCNCPQLALEYYFNTGRRAASSIAAEGSSQSLPPGKVSHCRCQSTNEETCSSLCNALHMLDPRLPLSMCLHSTRCDLSKQWRRLCFCIHVPYRTTSPAHPSKCPSGDCISSYGEGVN